MKEQLSTFRSQILGSQTQGLINDIMKNPAFRSLFHEICSKVR
ncbi:hypothetical protein Hanom_Chr03g00199061 [Helianthus anomalus]